MSLMTLLLVVLLCVVFLWLVLPLVTSLGTRPSDESLGRRDDREDLTDTLFRNLAKHI